MNKIVGIGAAVMDTLVTLPVFPEQDTKMEATAVKQCGGGPAATGIVTAAKLGIGSGYIGVLSDDASGQFLMSDFKQYDVSTEYIDVKSGYCSFISQIWLDVKNESRTIVYDKGNLPPLALSNKQKQAIANAEILMLDGNELSAAIEGAKIAKSNKTLILYDAGGLYEGVRNLLPLVDILIPSKEFALSETDENSVENAAIKLFEKYNPKVVVITCGKDGGVLYAGDGIISYPVYPVEVVDSNGAGDVFHGAFAVAVVKGLSYEQCCYFASATSAIKCTGVGARESVPDYQTTINYLRNNNYEL